MRKAFPALALLLLSSGCATVAPRQPLPPAVQPQPAAVYHTLEKGQTLWRVSHMYNIDLRSLMAANGITDPAHVAVGQRLRIPQAVPANVRLPVADRDIERRVGTPPRRVPWRTITVHHSATRYGNARVFDRVHRKRGMGGLFYHFLIGNGNGMDDGEVTAGWRWRDQAEVNRPRDIQICLVGNFMKQQVTDRQYDSLKKLIGVLRRRYGIGADDIRIHCDVGQKATECPGRNFPYARLLRDVREGR